MPKISNRLKIIKHLDSESLSCGILHCVEYAIGLLSDQELQSDLLDEELLQLCLIRIAVESSRYLIPRALAIRAPWSIPEILSEMNDDTFQQQIRMTRTAHSRIAALLLQDPVFSNHSTISQSSVEDQLAVVSYRFGRYGSAASCRDIGARFNISKGTVDMFTSRIIRALLNLKSTFLNWPSDAEKRALSTTIKEQSGFPYCMGFADGTLVGLSQKPVVNGEDYYSRKKCYALSCLIVCDDQRRIRYCHAGKHI